MENFIDPSLAKGIRRAYLESLDSAWGVFKALRAKERRRQPYLQVKTARGFDKETEKLRRNVEHAGLMQSEITIKTKRKCLWSSLFLTREIDDFKSAGKGMTSTGHARAEVMALAYPPGREWAHPLNIRISAHAIDRVIQRMGLIDLPIKREDIRTINAELSQSLIWATASFFILEKLGPRDADNLTLIFPSQHGFFIGKFDSDPINLSLVTYIDRSNTWAEQMEAFKILDSVTEPQLAFLASDVIARHHIEAEHTDFDDRIYKCWRDYGWRIEEKLDRPFRLDSAWNSRSTMPQYVKRMT